MQTFFKALSELVKALAELMWEDRRATAFGLAWAVFFGTVMYLVISP